MEVVGEGDHAGISHTGMENSHFLQIPYLDQIDMSKRQKFSQNKAWE